MNRSDLCNLLNQANRVSRFGYHDERAVLVFIIDGSSYSFRRRSLDVFEEYCDADDNYRLQLAIERNDEGWKMLNCPIYEKLPISRLLNVSSVNKNWYVSPDPSFIFE
ncbi:hypothetical protein J4467_00395 [Candidatus Woesearchaeota archaeon]|nr:hypothetical protein [Candidatus Woesearchaeota archaeon]